jgi:glucosamine--fructose-6-phosphate aminotransferase (isomerizing)
MCGIIGYVGERAAVPIVLEGLKRLEYRGYDSAGVAVLTNGSIERRRTAGKVSALGALLAKAPLSGTTALGHTRWATHGSPKEENAHPHSDCTGGLVVIHNGIIENYIELRSDLARRGHRFSSETDTEVVAHWIEEALKRIASPHSPREGESALVQALQAAVKSLRGAYALAVLWNKAPGVIVCAKTASPLVVGLGRDENFLASDAPAFLSHTRRAVYLEDGEIAVLSRERCRLMRFDGTALPCRPVKIPWKRALAEKEGFKHFMLKEIYDQPQAIEDTLRGRVPFSGPSFERETGLASSFLSRLKRARLIGCGTAYHACLVGRYWMESLAGIPAEAETASEFRYRESVMEPGELVIAVSQSGETADTLGAARLARSRGAKVLAVTNCLGSSLSREADFSLYTRCGPELGVASTKAFTGQMSALAVVAARIGLARGMLPRSRASELARAMLALPAAATTALKLDAEILKVARKLRREGHFFYIGRDLNYAVALEGALKLKEISYLHAEGYAGGELKHGPIALIEKGIPVVALATRSRLRDKIQGAVSEVTARGARLIAVQTEGDPPVHGADAILRLPECPEVLAPILAVIPLQLLAYHIADLRGCDVDQPRNLAKSVTVE